MYQSFRFIIVVLLGINLFSCVPLKESIYLQGDLTKKLKDIDELYKPEKSEYLIKPNDILYITVGSLDERTSAFLNTNTGFTQLPETPTSMNLMGYRVYLDGAIDFPFIGKIFIAGLTLNQAQEKIHLAVSKYIDKSSVTIKLLNDNITVLGEVNSPGRFPLAGEELNIMEAISLAGETTNYSNKKKIRLIRREGDSYQMIEINTLDENIVFSPYYYLKPGDIIYVLPRRLKSLALSSEAFGFYLTLLNTGLLLYTTYLAYYNTQNSQ